jgi:hypothetical protein
MSSVRDDDDNDDDDDDDDDDDNDKISIFLDNTQCISLKINRCFGGTHLLRLHGRRIKQDRN